MIELRNINFRYAGGTDAGGLVNIGIRSPGIAKIDIAKFNHKRLPPNK